MAKATAPKPNLGALLAQHTANELREAFKDTATKRKGILYPTPSWPLPLVPGYSFGVLEFNTGPVLADGTVNSWVISNSSGADVFVTAMTLWLGADLGAQMDIHFNVTDSGGNFWGFINGDHYGPGSLGAGCRQFRFDPPMALPKGAMLALSGMGNAWGKQAHTHCIVHLTGYRK